MKLVTVAGFLYVHEAKVANGALEASGIEAFIADEVMVYRQWGVDRGGAGIRLMVREEDLSRALETLNRPATEPGRSW